MKRWVVVVAAGRGTRTGLPYNKAFYTLLGRSVLSRCLDALTECRCFDGATVVLSREDGERYASLLKREGPFPLVKETAVGGETRQESVYSGLLTLPADAQIVAIHDAARAFVAPELVSECVRVCEEAGSAVAASALTDTVKRVNGEGLSVETPDRERLRAVQTPQVFTRHRILEAHERARAEGFSATDDAALVERYFGPVRLVVSALPNPKITTAEDVRAMEALLSGEQRVGIGYDAHRLAAGRPLRLGGVTIPYEKGLLGHSDADAAIHALIDALLGGAALGDIGALFPDTDPAYAGISSLLLLKETVRRLAEAGFFPKNADLTIVCQRPKLAPYVPAMRDALAEALGIGRDLVSVKATTTENMGFEGRGEGVSAMAVATVRRAAGGRAQLHQ